MFKFIFMLYNLNFLFCLLDTIKKCFYYIVKSRKCVIIFRYVWSGRVKTMLWTVLLLHSKTINIASERQFQGKKLLISRITITNVYVLCNNKIEILNIVFLTKSKYYILKFYVSTIFYKLSWYISRLLKFFEYQFFIRDQLRKWCWNIERWKKTKKSLFFLRTFF